MTNLFDQVAHKQTPIEILIGTYLNRYLYTDINPIGEVIGVKGKNTLIVRQVQAIEMKTKLEFVPGGFSAICINQWAQEWEYETTDTIIEVRVTKQNARQIQSDNNPIKYYDYNF